VRLQNFCTNFDVIYRVYSCSYLLVNSKNKTKSWFYIWNQQQVVLNATFRVEIHLQTHIPRGRDQDHCSVS
jgi:hypothetical protein